MLPQETRIMTRMEVISADGRRVGYVERMTEAQIVTLFPCRHISLASVLRVTDEVHIAQRYSEVQETPLLPGHLATKS